LFNDILQTPYLQFQTHEFFHLVMCLSLKIDKTTLLFVGTQLPSRYPNYNSIANCQPEIRQLSKRK